MTPADIALARRAVACPRWRWLPGMLTDDGTTVCSQSDDGYLLVAGSEGSCVSWWPIGGHLPDLADPATLGCLLALVREAHECPEAHVYFADVTRLFVVRWRARGGGLRSVDARTEAEALLAALEVAP